MQDQFLLKINISYLVAEFLHLKNLHIQVLSRDSVTVSVDAVVYYRVSNPTMATNNIEDYRWLPNQTKLILSFYFKVLIIFQPFDTTVSSHHFAKCPGHKEPRRDFVRAWKYQPRDAIFLGWCNRSVGCESRASRNVRKTIFYLNTNLKLLNGILLKTFSHMILNFRTQNKFIEVFEVDAIPF